MLNDIFEYNYNLSLLNLYSYTDCTLFKSFMGGATPWSIERSCAVGGRYPPGLSSVAAPLGGATPRRWGALPPLFDFLVDFFFGTLVSCGCAWV